MHAFLINLGGFFIKKNVLKPFFQFLQFTLNEKIYKSFAITGLFYTNKAMFIRLKLERFQL
jgi:hypothetical protein